MKRIVIWGTKNSAIEIYEIITNDYNDWEVIGFIDDSESRSQKVIDDKYIIGDRTFFYMSDYGEYSTVIGLNDPKDKMEAIEYSNRNNIRLQTIISKKAFVSKLANIGKGSVVHDFATIRHGVTIGSGVSIGNYSLIESDTLIDDFCTICSHVIVSKLCKINKGSFLTIKSHLAEKTSTDNFSNYEST